MTTYASQIFALWVGRVAPVSAGRLSEELLAHCARIGLDCTIEERKRLFDTKLTLTVDGPADEVQRFRDMVKSGYCQIIAPTGGG